MSWLSDVWDKATGKDIQKQQAAQQLQYQQQQAAALKAQQDAAAAAAAKQQQQQQAVTANTNTNRSAIDTAFAQFNDPYYAGIAKNYNDYYLPQVDQQEGVARDKLTAQLAGQGTLSSTVGANALATLAKDAALQRANVGGQATDYANSIRDKVNTSKTALYGQNLAAADPASFASNVQGQASTFANPASLTPAQPIGDVFASLLTPATAALTASSNLLKGSNQNFGVSSYTPTSGAGSSRVIT